MEYGTMKQVPSISEVTNPTHVSKCSGTVEHAYVFSVISDKYYSSSWLKLPGDEDAERIQNVNESLPDIEEVNFCIECTLKRGASKYFLLENHIVSIEDGVKMDMPDAVYLQRISPRNKTFDMVCFYGKKFSVFSAIDKAHVHTIREWFPDEVFSGGADPLPLRAISKQLVNMTHAEIFEELFGESSAEESEYEPDSDDEQDGDHDLDDEIYESDEWESDTEDEWEPERKRLKT
tara:strand:+ start:1462 stop:2163 length:702 start_codon:yes stop_codon:yes gene_type:complete